MDFNRELHHVPLGTETRQMTNRLDVKFPSCIWSAGAEPVDEGYFCDNVLASYVHLHFGSNPEFAYSLVACCRRVDVERACNAAHEAVHPYDQPRRGSDDNIKRRGSTHHDSRRGSLSLVRSVPNLARMPPAVAIRRGCA
jgi:hypothetical protein